MNRKFVNALIPWLLATVTMAVLVISVLQTSQQNVTYELWALLLYGVLTAAALNLGVLLTEGELSPAHVVGMVAFLSLPMTMRAPMTGAIFAGGLIGGLLLVVRKSDVLPRRRLTARSTRSIIVIATRVTLSYFVASQVYTALNGVLPLERLADTWIALFLYSVVYVILYFAIFVLETYSDGRSVPELLKANQGVVLTVLLLPVPFAVLGAQVFNTLSRLSYIILMGGMMLVIAGLYGLSRTQFKFRKQVEELSSLAVVSQAMRTNLDLNALLNTVYLQVAHLLYINNFLVALYDWDEKYLTFPLAIRNGLPEDLPKDTMENTLIEAMLHSQSPLLITSDVAARAKAMGVQPPEANVYSWLGVPLLSGGRALGAFVVTSTNPQQLFGQEDLRLLNIVAANASVAVDNAQLYGQQKERSIQLTTLNNISSVLTGTLSPDKVLDLVISSATAISDANAVAIYLVQQEDDMLTLVRHAGFREVFEQNPPDPLSHFPKDRPLYSQPHAVVVSDVRSDRRTAHLRGIMEREGKLAWVELPLSVGDIPLGVVVVYYDTPQYFTGEGVELLRTFANQAAQSINNARLYAQTDRALSRRVSQLSALAETSRQLTATMELDLIYDMVLKRALYSSNAIAGAIVLRDDMTGKMVTAAHHGYPTGTFTNPAILMQGITGTVLRTGQAARVDDTRKDMSYVPFVPSTRSQLTVPVVRSGEPLGAITLESDQVGAFGAEEVDFVTQLANQAIIAVDNARLFHRIAEARDRLQVILDAMAEAIMLVDSVGGIALANPRVSMLGLRPFDMVGCLVEDLLERPDMDFAERIGFRSDQEVRKLIKELRTPGYWVGREPVSYVVQKGSETTNIQRQVIPVKDERGEAIGMLLVFYDETVQRELDQAREDLSRMIVHDLRGPLTAVTMSLKLLTEVIPQSSEYRSIVESTTDASQRAIRKLLNLVDSLLDIAKIESGQMVLDIEQTDVSIVMDSVVLELGPVAQELDITLRSDVTKGLPRVEIDSDKIERVILNLVDNALKFTPSDGNVIVRAVAAGEMLRVEVVDSGPGVPDEYKARLFERFVQVKGRRGARRGTGLGLTFCRLAVEAHGGRIWVDDNPDGGSIFAFTIPALKEELLPLPPELPTAPAPSVVQPTVPVIPSAVDAVSTVTASLDADVKPDEPLLPTEKPSSDTQ